MADKKKPAYKVAQEKAKSALEPKLNFESITKNGAHTTFHADIRKFKRTWREKFGEGGYIVVQEYKDRAWSKK